MALLALHWASIQEGHHHTWCYGLSRHDGHPNALIGCTDDWQAYLPALLACSCLCWPRNRTRFFVAPKVNQCWGDHQQEGIWELLPHHGIHVKHYHAYNEIFASNAWKENCKTNNQGLDFAGINAHHQHRIAKQWIQELQEIVQTMLLQLNSCKEGLWEIVY